MAACTSIRAARGHHDRERGRHGGEVLVFGAIVALYRMFAAIRYFDKVALIYEE